MEQSNRSLLRRIRWCLGFFMVGLVLSGVTAFPLQGELRLLDNSLSGANGNSMLLSNLAYWIHTVHEGVETTYAQYPWMAYGTDWLAFAHIIIAIFFIGPFLHPVRNIWVLQAGMAACVLVIPLALICGAFRHIPFGWRLIDCSFGIIGIVPLYFCWRWARRLELSETKP
jgi:hypothetical protein